MGLWGVGGGGGGAFQASLWVGIYPFVALRNGVKSFVFITTAENEYGYMSMTRTFRSGYMTGVISGSWKSKF